MTNPTSTAQKQGAEQRIELVRQNAARAAENGFITWTEASRLVNLAYEREASDGT